MVDANKKTSRGRPKKEFVSRKTPIKRDKPGRPKKEVIITTNPPKEIVRKNIANHKDDKENTKKDRFILGMFIFSLFLFALSLYLSQRSENKVPAPIEPTNTSTIQTGVLVETGNDTLSRSNENIENEENIVLSPETILITNFYQEFNKGSLLAMYPNIDNALLSSATFKKFFGKTWIQRFLRNISTEGVSLNNIESNNEENPTLNYQISYTLKDGQYFEEMRQIKILTKDTPKIGSIKCVSTGCSTLPFMNPGKYKLQ